jgi:hypothetical protein
MAGWPASWEPARKDDAMSNRVSPDPERRRFVRWLGLGSVLGLFGGALGGLVAGQARAQSGSAAKPATPPAAATPAAPTPPSEDAKALHSILVGRYGEHMDAEQKEALLGAIDGTVQGGKALRARKLANSVEPAVIYRAQPPLRDQRAEAGR